MPSDVTQPKPISDRDLAHCSRGAAYLQRNLNAIVDVLGGDQIRRGLSGKQSRAKLHTISYSPEITINQWGSSFDGAILIVNGDEGAVHQLIRRISGHHLTDAEISRMSWRDLVRTAERVRINNGNDLIRYNEYTAPYEVLGRTLTHGIRCTPVLMRGTNEPATPSTNGSGFAPTPD